MRLILLFPALILFAPHLGADDPKKKADGPAFQVPYRLTDTKHVLVRAKINGKGPYNFIVDTGAPTLFIATAVGKKLGVEPDDKGWGALDRFEIEGGVVVEKTKAKIADPFQLEGMNQLGLAGVELHGIIGYTILARYRIGFDFSKDKLSWTALDFEPPLPRGIGGKDAGVDALGGLVKVMATLLGKQFERETRYRGSLGVELKEQDGRLVIGAVLSGSPAGEAKLAAGDELADIDGQRIKTRADAERVLARRSPGDTVEVTVIRDADKRAAKIQLGKGF